MKIFRKLKDYMQVDGNCTTFIFGTLNSTDCHFVYDALTDETLKEYDGGYNIDGEYDFLLDYYVLGVNASYKIEDNRIIPYLVISLSKENPEHL